MEYLGYAITAILALASGAYLERLKSREWVKQEQWRYKRDLYQQLTDAIADWGIAQARLSMALETPMKNHDPFVQAIDAQDRINRLRPLVAIFASSETVKLVAEFEARTLRVAKSVHAAQKPSEIVPVLNDAEQAATVLLVSLSKVIRSDLEF